jgi:hypothetical protein
MLSLSEMIVFYLKNYKYTKKRKQRLIRSYNLSTLYQENTLLSSKNAPFRSLFCAKMASFCAQPLAGTIDAGILRTNYAQNSQSHIAHRKVKKLRQRIASRHYPVFQSPRALAVLYEVGILPAGQRKIAQMAHRPRCRRRYGTHLGPTFN